LVQLRFFAIYPSGTSPTSLLSIDLPRIQT
jgi:hypothetical protein